MRSTVLAALALAGCATPAAQAPAEFRLEPVWVRVGDSRGSIDAENEIAEVESTVFSPDGKLIAAVSKDAGDVSLWTIDGRQLWRRNHENEPLDEVEAIAFTRDGRFLMSGGEDRRIRVWRVSDGLQVASLPTEGSVEGMALSHDGTRLATGDEAGRLSVWDVSAGDPASWPARPIAVGVNGPDMDSRSNPGAQGVHADINSVSWTRDGRHVFTAGRNALVRQWEVARIGTGEDHGVVRSFTGFANSIKTVRLSPDERLLAAGGQLSPDGLVLVWDVATGVEVARLAYATFPKIEAVEWSPDGRWLLTGGIEGFDFAETKYTEGMGRAGLRYPGANGFGRIRAYDRRRGFAEAGGVDVFRQEFFDFTADGRLMVSAHGDGTLRLWRVRS
jgi:WD40 repeat protein